LIGDADDGVLEVGEHQDVEEVGARRGTEASRR
jgi:hypothetical protein